MHECTYPNTPWHTTGRMQTNTNVHTPKYTEIHMKTHKWTQTGMCERVIEDKCALLDGSESGNSTCCHGGPQLPWQLPLCHRVVKQPSFCLSCPDSIYWAFVWVLKENVTFYLCVVYKLQPWICGKMAYIAKYSIYHVCMHPSVSISLFVCVKNPKTCCTCSDTVYI